MQRRTFLRNAGIAGAMITCLPSKGFSSLLNPGYTAVALPESKSHVRHGEFGSLTSCSIPGFEGMEGYQRDVFFANGFEAGAGDMTSLRFKYRGEQCALSFIEGAVHALYKHHSRAIALSSKGLQELELHPALHAQVEVFEGSSRRSFQFPRNVMVLAVVPPVEVNRKAVAEDEAVLIKAGQAFTLHGNPGSTYLMLQEV